MNDQNIRLFRAEIGFNATIAAAPGKAFTRAEVDAISKELNDGFTDFDFCLTDGDCGEYGIFEDKLSHFQVLDIDGDDEFTRDDPADPEARFAQEIPAEAVWVLYVLADSGDAVEKYLEEAALVDALIPENGCIDNAGLAVFASINIGDMYTVQVMEMTPADKELLDLDEWSDCIPYYFGESFSGNDTCKEWLEGRAQFGRY